MKKFVKMIALSLALLMLAAPMFACSDTGEDTPTDKPTEKETDKMTDKPTEKPTEKPAENSTEKPADTTTEPAPTEPAEKTGGCGSSISALGVAFICLLGACAVSVRNKYF